MQRMRSALWVAGASAALLVGVLYSAPARADLIGTADVQLLAPGGIDGVVASLNVSQTVSVTQGIVAPTLALPSGVNVDPTDPTTVGYWMLDGESITFTGNSILVHVDGGAQNGSGQYITGYLGSGGQNAIYDFSGLTSSDGTITGIADVYDSDNYATSGSSGLIDPTDPAQYVQFLSDGSIALDLDTLLFIDRNSSDYNYADFRIDLTTEADTGPGGGDNGNVPEPGSLACLSAAGLGLLASARARRRT